MDDEKSNNFFWPSYVDLMTALFAVVLVLFVLSFKLFSDKNRDLNMEKDKVLILLDKYQKIENIEKQMEALDSAGIFKYDRKFRRYIVKDLEGVEIFDSNKWVIREKYRQPAIKAGEKINNLIRSFDGEKDIRFMIVIEGNAANKWDGSYDTDSEHGYKLSYNRALALFYLWKEEEIDFPEGTEIIISGSGFSGIGRDPEEKNNKRFIIHIIPKVDKL